MPEESVPTGLEGQGRRNGVRQASAPTGGGGYWPRARIQTQFAAKHALPAEETVEYSRERPRIPPAHCRTPGPTKARGRGGASQEAAGRATQSDTEISEAARHVMTSEVPGYATPPIFGEPPVQLAVALRSNPPVDKIGFSFDRV
jgi:hypothetical protein